jgi:hypothetical protein
MRHLVAVLMIALATAAAQGKQAGEVRPTAAPKDPPKSSLTTPDRLIWPQGGARDKARGKTVDTIIPDICTGC